MNIFVLRGPAIAKVCVGVSLLISVAFVLGALVHGTAIVYLGGFFGAVLGALFAIAGVLLPRASQRVRAVGIALFFSNCGITLWLRAAMGQAWAR